MQQIISSARLNETRDNERYLKGLDGPVEIEDALNVLGAVTSNGQPIGANADFQRFTSSGTWTKPDGVNLVLVQIIAGGAGGTRTTSGTRTGGLPGGMVTAFFEASDLSATESVVVGAGGTAAGTPTTRTGGNSSFGGVTAYGGDSDTVSPTPYGILQIKGFLHPGTGGASIGTTASRLGVGGYGTDFSASGADGADSTYGTGAGGGGNVNGHGGDGGAPGGGGGAVTGSTTWTPGAGGRGEVRVWAW